MGGRGRSYHIILMRARIRSDLQIGRARKAWKKTNEMETAMAMERNGMRWTRKQEWWDGMAYTDGIQVRKEGKGRKGNKERTDGWAGGGGRKHFLIPLRILFVVGEQPKEIKRWYIWCLLFIAFVVVFFGWERGAGSWSLSKGRGETLEHTRILIPRLTDGIDLFLSTSLRSIFRSTGSVSKGDNRDVLGS